MLSLRNVDTIDFLLLSSWCFTSTENEWLIRDGEREQGRGLGVGVGCLMYE